MSSEDYRVRNVIKYSRKTYKKNRRGIHDCEVNNSQLDMHNETDASPGVDSRSEDVGTPVCSCGLALDPDVEIADILHKKYPVIALAQKQLQRLLDETDILLSDNMRCCSSVCEFLWLCKELLASKHKYYCIAILLIGASFFFGLILGAGSCGSYLEALILKILIQH